MTIVASNFQVVPGDSKDILIDLVDAVGQPLYAAETFTASLTWTINLPGRAVALSKTLLAGDFIWTSETQVQLHLDPADTAGLQGTYEHRAVLVDTSGNVSTLLTGSLLLPTYQPANVPVRLVGQADVFASAGRVWSLDFSLADNSGYISLIL